LARALYTISVFIHVVAACAWVGSMLFFSVVVVPVLRRSDRAAAPGALVRLLGIRFRTFGWACIGALILTGALNLGLSGVGTDTLASGQFWANGFGRVLAYKLIASLLTVLIAVWLVRGAP